MKELKLNLTLDETNMVLAALGNLPYAQVNQLINKIQVQAKEQLNGLAKDLGAEPKVDAKPEAVTPN